MRISWTALAVVATMELLNEVNVLSLDSRGQRIVLLVNSQFIKAEVCS